MEAEDWWCEIEHDDGSMRLINEIINKYQETDSKSNCINSLRKEWTRKRFSQIFINFTATRFHLVCFVVFVFDGNALNYFYIHSNHLIVNATYGEGQWTIDYLQWYLQRLFKVVGSSSFFVVSKQRKNIWNLFHHA